MASEGWVRVKAKLASFAEVSVGSERIVGLSDASGGY